MVSRKVRGVRDYGVRGTRDGDRVFIVRSGRRALGQF